jgi:hypothetical protein
MRGLMRRAVVVAGAVAVLLGLAVGWPALYLILTIGRVSGQRIPASDLVRPGVFGLLAALGVRRVWFSQLHWPLSWLGRPQYCSNG